jgi:hypothetical protein
VCSPNIGAGRLFCEERGVTDAKVFGVEAVETFVELGRSQRITSVSAKKAQSKLCAVITCSRAA